MRRGLAVLSTVLIALAVAPAATARQADTGPVTGEPGIWYQNGRVTATLDAEGNTTSVSNTGKLVDLYLQLAS
jgi:hypothetical protein